MDPLSQRERSLAMTLLPFTFFPLNAIVGKMLHKVFVFLLNVCFPPRCQACRSILPFSNTASVCEPCVSRIRWIEPPHCVACGRSLGVLGICPACPRGGEKFHFDRALACAAFEGPVREMLHRYKFNRKTVLKSFLTQRLLEFASKNLKKEDFDAVLAVPLDPAGHDSRGFNQSRVLSDALGKKMALKDLSSALGRKKSLSHQSLLAKTARKTNVRGAFFLKDKTAFRRFKRVLLVDDILTSGQTLSECAKTLKESGAQSVTALAFARAL